MNVRLKPVSVLLLISLPLATLGGAALAESSITYRGVAVMEDYYARVVPVAAESVAEPEVVVARACKWAHSQLLSDHAVHEVSIARPGQSDTPKSFFLTTAELRDLHNKIQSSKDGSRIKVVSSIGNVDMTALEDGNESPLSLSAETPHAWAAGRETIRGCPTPPLAAWVEGESMDLSIVTALPRRRAVVLPTMLEALGQSTIRTTEQDERLPPGILRLHVVHKGRTVNVTPKRNEHVAITLRGIFPFRRAKVKRP